MYLCISNNALFSRHIVELEFDVQCWKCFDWSLTCLRGKGNGPCLSEPFVSYK